MKYKSFYWNFFSIPMKKSVTKRIGKDRAKQIMVNGKKEYRAIIECAPELGSSNPFALNMYFACVFIGLWLGTGKELSPETMGEIMAESLKTVKPLFGLINLNRPSHAKLVQSQMADKYLKWYDKHGKEYPTTWEMKGNAENRHGVYYELRNCPICALCNKEGIPEIMPPMCALDTLMFSMMHGKLIRNQMIASGGEMCDYWIIGDGENEQNTESI